MGRRARLRSKLRDEDVEELQELLGPKQAVPQAEPEAETNGTKADPTNRVLELQKTAGNRAVGAALSRWPVFGAPMVAQWPKERQMIVDGTPIPLESFQEGIHTSGTGTSGTGGNMNKTGATGPGEMVVTLKMGKHSSELLMQATTGPGFKTVEIVIPTRDGKGVRFILTDVLISSYSISGSGSGDSPLEALSLNFKKREFSQDPPPPGGPR